MVSQKIFRTNAVKIVQQKIGGVFRKDKMQTKKDTNKDKNKGGQHERIDLQKL